MPGKSIFIEALDQETKGPAWPGAPVSTTEMVLYGPWNITFLQGHPQLPKAYQVEQLDSWTKAPDTLAQYFSGTARYNLNFSIAGMNAGQAASLDLGDLREMARVRLNGKDLGQVWCLPFTIEVPEGLLQKDNQLEIEVTNLSANRIRYLDRQKTPWKKFYDINIVDIRYTPFDASKWEPVPSGLLGPVKLTLKQ